MQLQRSDHSARLSTGELIDTIRRLLAEQRRIDRLLCQHLADLADRIAAREPGPTRAYGDIRHAARCLFGLSTRATRDRVRVGRALRELPLVNDAFQAGRLSYSRVREVTRIATPADERRWLALAERVSMSELERRVVAAGGGDERDQRTSEPARVSWTSPETVEVRLALPAETWALVRRAMEGARRAADESGLLSDADALAAVAKEALARQADTERNEVHRAVVLYECQSCKRTELETGAGAVELGDGAAATLGCGAVVRDLRTEGRIERRGGPLPKSVERAVRLRDRSCCRAPGCTRRRWVDVHHLQERARGGKHSRSNCLCLCDTHHRKLHDGEIVITGDPEGTLDVRGAGGTLIADPSGAATQPGSPKYGDEQMAADGARLVAFMGRRGGWSVDALCEGTGMHVSSIMPALLVLEMMGQLRGNPWTGYAVTARQDVYDATGGAAKVRADHLALRRDE